MAKGGGAAGVSGGAAVERATVLPNVITARLITGAAGEGRALLTIERATGRVRIETGNRTIRAGNLGRTPNPRTDRGAERVARDALRTLGIRVLPRRR